MGALSGGLAGIRAANATKQYLPEAEQRSLMAELGQRSGQAIEGLGLLLDTPGAIARGVLAGDPLSGFSFDRQSRVSGEDLLGVYGLKPSNPYMSTIAGLATDIALDPLSFATMPFMAAGRAGAAAAKAGLTKYAPYVATLKKGSEATSTGAMTLKSITDAGLKPTSSVLQTRPLVGPRLAQATTTLDEVVRAAPDPTLALKNVKIALGDVPYDEVKNEKIGGLFGFNNPFTGSSSAYNPRMGDGILNDLTNLNIPERIADTLDRTGQSLAWSYPTRLISSMVSKSVDGQIGVGDQITAMRKIEADTLARKIGRTEGTEHALGLAELKIPGSLAQSSGVDDFFSPAGGDVLLRLVENKAIGNDLDFLRQVPGLDDWIVGWKQIAASKLAKAKQLGLSDNELQSVFGTAFSPRSTPELNFTDVSMNKSANPAAYSATIQNQMKRAEDLDVPGGTYQLQQISLDPRVRAWAKGQTQETEQEIGAYIGKLIGNPLVTDEQSMDIARVMRRMDPNLPDNVPVFGTHPILEQMGYIVKEELRRSRAVSAYEALADAAINASKRDMPGGKHISMSEALKRVGDKIGLVKRSPEARDTLRSMVATSLFQPGTAPKAVRLNALSVPEEVVNRIMRLSDFYSAPVVQGEVLGLYDKFTTLFKASVLSWPSRFVRDMYSNMFSVWLENGNAAETLQGLRNASLILNNKYQDALPYLMGIPRYQGKSAAEVQRMFQLDVGSSGILQGLASSDLLSSSRRGDIGQFLPGSTPISVGRALKELVPDGTTTLAQKARDFATIRGVTTNFQTKNPIYNASQVLGDTVDSMGRLGGFMSLMKLGVAPDEAASRMMAALVDYSSLTPFERSTIRRIVPWWAFNSRIGAYAVRSITANPGGRYAQTIRAVNDLQATTEETYIPTALRQRFAIRVPQALTPEGNPTAYLTDIDLPGFDTLNLLRMGYQTDTAGAVLQTAQNTLSEVMQQTNPLIRSIAELGTGQDFFSKRPLDQAVTAYDTLYRAASGDKYARINPLLRAAMSNAVSMVPLGPRGVSLTANLVDARIPNVPFRVLKAGVNNLTGVKIQNVDGEYEALDALEKIKQQNAPYTSEMIRQYIPAERLPNIPVENQRLNALSQELQRNLREIYARRYER